MGGINTFLFAWPPKLILCRFFFGAFCPEFPGSTHLKKASAEHFQSGPSLLRASAGLARPCHCFLDFSVDVEKLKCYTLEPTFCPEGRQSLFFFFFSHSGTQRSSGPKVILLWFCKSTLATRVGSIFCEQYKNRLDEGRGTVPMWILKGGPPNVRWFPLVFL